MDDWSAVQDARDSSSSHPNNLLEMADDWAARAVKHYTAFYLANPTRVKEMVGPSDALLVVGLFAGWDDKGHPSLVVMGIGLDPAAVSPFDPLVPIFGSRSVAYERDLPYTTNSDTRNLIEGDSVETRAIAKQWMKREQKFPKAQRDWRWVEFLVQSTNAYDKTVGKTADVLEIRKGSSTWLRHSGCAAH